MVVLPPVRERAVVVLQNTYGVLRDGEIQAVALGLAHLVAGGDSPASPGTGPLHPAMVWGTTAVAAVLGAGTVAAARARRPRTWATASWTVPGLVAAGAAVWLVAGFGLRPALTWLPDVSVALLVAGVLGAAVTVLRFLAHHRART